MFDHQLVYVCVIKGTSVGGGCSKTLRRSTWVGSAGSDEVTEREGERGAGGKERGRESRTKAV